MTLYDNTYDYCHRCGQFTFMMSDGRCLECHDKYIAEINKELGDIVE